MTVGFYVCVFFLPHDRVTLRYCWSWSDSSEPATSHSAVPHTQGQECHYLPLHTDTEQHMRSFIAHTILTHTNTWPYAHRVACQASRIEGHRHGDLSSWDFICLVLWEISQRSHHSPWAAGASLTTPSVSVVNRGELKFLLKAPVWQAGRDAGRHEREDKGRRNVTWGGKKAKGMCNILLKDNTCVVLSGGGGPTVCEIKAEYLNMCTYQLKPPSNDFDTDILHYRKAFWGKM